jgi:hypothetical protein
MAAVQAESERTGATTEVAETENSGLDDAAAAGNAGNEDARPDARQPGTGRPTLV